MNATNDFRKLALDLITYEVSNSSDYMKAKGKHKPEIKPLPRASFWTILVILGLNIFSLLLTRHLATFGSNLFLFIVLAATIWWNNREIKNAREFNKKNQQIAAKLKQGQQALIEKLEKLLRDNPDLKVFPFWRHFDGLEYFDNKNTNYIRWVNPEHIRQDKEDGTLHLYSYDRDEKRIKGRDVLDLKESLDLFEMPINSKPINSNGTYLMGELIETTIFDASITVNTSASEQSIQNQMSSYRSHIDNMERGINAVNDGLPLTNEERMYSGTMSYSDYAQGSITRDFFENEHEEKLRKRSNGTEILDFNTWCYHDTPIGILVMTQDTKEAVALLFYKEKHAPEMFKTTSMNRGYGKIIRRTQYKAEEGVDVRANLSNILIRLAMINFPQFDLAQPKPDSFSDEEWASWIYAQKNYTLK